MKIRLFFTFIIMYSLSNALMLKVPDITLVKNSDLIIRGAVVSKEVQWINNNSTIYTFVEINIKEVLKEGIPHTSIIVIAVPGGYDPEQDIGLKISDQPEFTKNEEAILYLNRAEGIHDGINYNIANFSKTIYTRLYRVNSLYQGKHDIRLNSNDNKSRIVIKANDGTTMPLKNYISRVIQLIKNIKK